MADAEVPREPLPLSSSWHTGDLSGITETSIGVLFQFLLLARLRKGQEVRTRDRIFVYQHLAKAGVGEGGERALLSSFSAPEKSQLLKNSSHF